MSDPTQLASDPVSDTPKTDAAQVVAIYEGHGGLFVEAAFAREQERGIAELTAQRDEAIAMLADWCVRVDKQGTGWDDWDEAYKNAASRPCGIRELLDIAIHNEGINYVR